MARESPRTKSRFGMERQIETLRFLRTDTFEMHRPNVEKHLAFGHGVHNKSAPVLPKCKVKTGLERIFERFPHIHWTGKQTISPNALACHFSSGVVHVASQTASVRLKSKFAGSKQPNSSCAQQQTSHPFFHSMRRTLHARTDVSG